MKKKHSEEISAILRKYRATPQRSQASEAKVKKIREALRKYGQALQIAHYAQHTMARQHSRVLRYTRQLEDEITPSNPLNFVDNTN